MTKVRVGVLRGGPSSEYSVSLETGRHVLQSLPEKYHPHDIFISRDGVWHVSGFPKNPHEALNHIDVVFNALHGEFGEDGHVQRILDHFSIPYTGSGALASSVGMNKVLSKNIFRDHGLNVAHSMVAGSEDSLEKLALNIFRTFPLPAMVKPVACGSSVGVTLAATLDSLVKGLALAFQYGREALIEEYIRGKEATCGVVESFRGQSVYALLPVEIRAPVVSPFFDYHAKYSGASEEICPGNFTETEKKEIQEAAVKAHQALRLRHYSRSDFIVTPRRGVYILESNTLPGLTAESLLPKSLYAVGVSMPHFLDHLLTLALSGR